jgi:hypothetical protein
MPPGAAGARSRQRRPDDPPSRHRRARPGKGGGTGGRARARVRGSRVGSTPSASRRVISRSWDDHVDVRMVGHRQQGAGTLRLKRRCGPPMGRGGVPPKAAPDHLNRIKPAYPRAKEAAPAAPPHQGFRVFYTVARRRRITPKANRALPRSASEAGSGTAAATDTSSSKKKSST